MTSAPDNFPNPFEATPPPPAQALRSGHVPFRLPPPLPRDAKPINLLGVKYLHLKTRDGDDMYLTRFGQPFWEHLLPENWYAKDWFEANRERLVGTSLVYLVPTRRIRGMELELVVKWSRVGEEVPLDTMSINRFVNAEFNSPFEEFALVMELRAGGAGAPELRIMTQKPLAIFVPSERLQLWQTGRSESRIAAKLARHPDVELDILRQYVVVYGWIKGLDITELATLRGLSPDLRQELYQRTTERVTHDLERKGYRMADMKPAHIIVRQREDGSLLRQPDGQMVYALVDYELLERTPEHEAAVRSVHRRHYLTHMARRFDVATDNPLPVHLRATNLLGVDYIFGHAESTGGLLWVVGKDPDLFNYFLPERWRRTPKESLSRTNAVFKTRTKDNINLVWRVSRVGDTPGADENGRRRPELLEHGFNAPFEEFAHALAMSRAVRTIYPRAIYMTGPRPDPARVVADRRRYDQLSHLLTPEGKPVLTEGREYITVWGFWNGPDELLASQDGPYYRGINAEAALAEGLINEATLADLMERMVRRLRQAGYEDLNLKPDHLLISFNPQQQMVTDTWGKPELRLCNFEFVRQCRTPD